MTAVETQFDLAIIGGGINGCGIARDAQGRGLSVLLVEQDDLAAHTSSASTKLIHGGLRYLEHYEFSLVRKSLQEREVLLAMAPHIARAMRFVMPHDPAMRPAWLIRCGLWLYDHLARRTTLPASTRVDLRNHPAGKALRATFRTGFEYSDAAVDDARLVVLNAVGARELGADVRTRCRLEQARRHADHWELTLRDSVQNTGSTVTARGLVNAGGPWAGTLLHRTLGIAAGHGVRLVKGSHIIVPQCFDHAYAYIFQNDDKRIVFAIPYERQFTLIGTTDLEYQGDPAAAAITDDEIAYLCGIAQRYFSKPIGRDDIVGSYSGVRPLLQEQGKSVSDVTRDYLLELDTDGAPVLSVFGGKLTTYRVLAEEALHRLRPVFNRPLVPWTASAPLPGGDIPSGDITAYLSVLIRSYPELPPALLHRYAHAYGSLARQILAPGLANMGKEVAPGLFEAELRYLCDREWAQTEEDILWRRSKLGLHLSLAEREAVGAWVQNRELTVPH